MNRWYRVIFVTKWLVDTGVGKYEIADVFKEKETAKAVREWFEGFKAMFESEYRAKILTYKIIEL